MTNPESVKDCFKFKIGDVVKFVVDSEGYGPKMLITSRLREECYGGVQIHYHVRPLRTNRTTGIPDGTNIRVSEIELREMTTKEKFWEMLLIEEFSQAVKDKAKELNEKESE